MYSVKSEEQFGDIFITSPSLSNMCGSNNLYYAREMVTSLGVPDYVFLSKNDLELLKMFSQSYKGISLSSKYSAVISYVAKMELASLEEISIFLRQNKNELLKSLGKLEEWGVIKFDDSTRQNVIFNSDFIIPKINSIAIELKLSSWEKALWQAIRNSNQFVSSFVVMPSNKLDLLRSKIDLFEVNNINTSVLDVESMVLTPIRDEKNEPSTYNRHYLEALDVFIKNMSRFEKVNFA